MSGIDPALLDELDQVLGTDWFLGFRFDNILQKISRQTLRQSIESNVGGPLAFLVDGKLDADWLPVSGAISGVEGPATSSENAVPRFADATGALIENTGVLIGDLGELYGHGLKRTAITASGDILAGYKGTMLECSSASDIVLTIQPDATFNHDGGFQLAGAQFSSGTVTLAAGAGVTLRAAGGRKTTTELYAPFTLYKRAANDWFLAGALRL